MLDRPTTTAADTSALQNHIDLARRIARYHARQVGDWAHVEDLESAALVGLAEASHRYDQAVNPNFEAYACQRIRGAVLDELRRQDHRPRRVRQRYCESQTVRERLRNQLGREPTTAEIADESGDTLERVAAALRSSPVFFVELNHETTADHGPSIAQSLDHERVLARVHAAIDELDERSRDVVQMYFFDGLKLRDIGERLGVTESRVCQLKRDAIARLERELKAALN